MHTDLTGQTVAGYPLERLLACDSYGEFYEARTSAEPIVVKVLRSDLRSDAGMAQVVAEGWQNAHRVTHPNLLAVLGAGVDPQHGAYVLQDSLHTRSLRRLVLDGICLNWRDVLEFAIQMTSALKVLHEAGLTHGDLNPFHLLTTFDGEVRVEGAGGISRVTRPLVEWMPPQALAYFAPERLQGGESSVCTDLYSLGACIYFAIAHHDPFGGHHADSVAQAVLEQNPAPPKQARGDVPREALGVLGLLMEKNPQHRYPTADDLLEHLNALKEGHPLRPMRWAAPVLERPTQEQVAVARIADMHLPPPQPPSKIRTTVAVAVHGLRVQVDATVPRSEKEKDGDYFYRTDRVVLAGRYWQEAWDAGAGHPGLKLKLSLVQPELKRAQYAALMGEARLAFATGAFKACRTCAHQALEFADDEARRAEAAQLEAEAVSKTGFFWG